MALLELRDVSAAYGSIQILHDVSLHVEPREVVSVIGPLERCVSTRERRGRLRSACPLSACAPAVVLF